MISSRYWAGTISTGCSLWMVLWMVPHAWLSWSMSSSKWTGPGPSLDSSRRCSLSARGLFLCLQTHVTELNHTWGHSLWCSFNMHITYSYKILTQHSNVYFILTFLYYMSINAIIMIIYTYIYAYNIIHIILYILIQSLSILCHYIKQDNN